MIPARFRCWPTTSLSIKNLYSQSLHTVLAGLFPPYFVAFPCHTQSMAASKRLVWRKNPSPIRRQVLSAAPGLARRRIRSFVALPFSYDRMWPHLASYRLIWSHIASYDFIYVSPPVSLELPEGFLSARVDSRRPRCRRSVLSPPPAAPAVRPLSERPLPLSENQETGPESGPMVPGRLPYSCKRQPIPVSSYFYARPLRDYPMRVRKEKAPAPDIASACISRAPIHSFG